MRAEIDRISMIMTDLIKADISSKGLIDTGALYNSIRAVASVNGSDFSIKITGLDYFNKLDQKYNIISDVKKSTGYQEVLDLTAKLYAKMAVEKIKKKK